MRSAPMRGLLALSIAAAACGARPPASAPADVDDPSEGDEREPGTEGDDPVDAIAAAPVAAATGADLLSEARRELAAMRESTYTHHTDVDEATGRFDYDCSGFVDYALRRVAPAALAELQAATVRRPLAKHFVAFLASRSTTAPAGWRPVARARDLEPGDIVAWLRPADVVSRNTGHVMIVRAQPTVEPGHPDRLDVPVIDSTSVRHGHDDSRTARKSTGLGEGTMILVVDGDGAATGYQWSHGRKARVHVTTVALGRLAPR